MAASSFRIKQFWAQGAGKRALEQFRETRDEWYLWSAYAAYRGAGLPVTETIMRWLNGHASEACARRIRSWL